MSRSTWLAHPADRLSTPVICRSSAVERLHSVQQISTSWTASLVPVTQPSALRAAARHLTTSANSFLAQVLLIVESFISNILGDHMSLSVSHYAAKHAAFSKNYTKLVLYGWINVWFFFSVAATKADDKCFSHANTYGNEFGNCGYSGSTPKPCEVRWVPHFIFISQNMPVLHH